MASDEPDDPATVLAPYRAVLAPGSALALHHISDDGDGIVP